MYKSYIWYSFDLCVLNPYVEEQYRLMAHLDSLSENMAYDLLLHTQKSMKFKVEFDVFEDGTLVEDDTKY